MFLLCNGILIFLAGKSGSTRASCSSFSEYQIIEESESDEIRSEIVMMQSSESVSPLYEAAEEDAAQDLERLTETDDRVYGGEIEQEINEENELIVRGDEDDAENEEPASNTEELNKKIEEFIRKMKEELKLEAQQQQVIAA